MCKWEDKAWYKRLFIGMHVSKISQETQLEVQGLLDELDEELAEIKADNLYSCLKSSVVEERFLHSVRSDLWYRGFLLALMSRRSLSNETRMQLVEFLPQKKSVAEKEAVAKALVDIIKSSDNEKILREKLKSFNPDDYRVESGDDDLRKSDEEEKIPDVINVCKQLSSELEQVVVTLRNGTKLEGRIITALLPDSSDNFAGAIYMYTNTGKTVRLLPGDISSLIIDEKYDSRFNTFHRMKELYDALMDTGLIGKRITGIRNYADDNFAVYHDYLYDSADEERNCYASINGPLVIEFDDGSNIAFSVFAGPTYGVKKDFEGKYEGDGKPNIDANVIFKNMIGKCFTHIELENFPLNEDPEDEELEIKRYPKDDIPTEAVANIHMYLDDGAIFEIKEYGAFDLLESDGSIACINIKEFWTAHGIPDKYE